MKFGLGIDTGGTYTDAVIMDLSDGRVLETNKTLTTHSDLIQGIEGVISGLNPGYLKDIRLVSVSTTLATNSTLEGKGHPAGLILAGYSINRELPVQHMVSVSGGHDANGGEADLLDLDTVRDFVNATKSRVFSYAISSYFAARNPEHELSIKQCIQDLTERPVVCGHELSMDLGAYERAATATLNSRLIPINSLFIRSVLAAMRARNINAPLMVMKCDGSLARLEEAEEKPVESIFSGPAASLVGAAHISGLKDCIAVDVGGTSTDIAFIKNGVPEISETGAVVGDWKTMVRAIRMRTSAVGGDSHVWMRNKFFIGPNRVIPLCLAAERFPNLIDKLSRPGKLRERVMDDILQPTSFFVRSHLVETYEDYSTSNYAVEFEMDRYERKIFGVVGDEPVSVAELSEKTGDHPLLFTKTLRSLVQKRCISQIGFTPTDALHVLGEYEAWEGAASRLGAKILGRALGQGEEDFCRAIKQKFAKNIALELIAFFVRDLRKSDLEKVMDSSDCTKFKITVPVVLIGAPVRAYVDELLEFVDADIRIPEYHEVGNAVGALVGNIIKRSEVLIRPAGPGNEKYLVFSEKERKISGNYQEALAYGLELSERLISEHMGVYGLDREQVFFNLERKDTRKGAGSPLETKLLGIGIGSPLKLK
ncbi:hydantoinase/oxoprolinase family protein [Methanosarcina sp. MTP4]|uniref:hydantoinase/oxoprolinase family protein n=1 Tax=Methanosarcina sp. MTP4 TaxID=1434100 RepID=UPI00064E4D55